MERNATIVYQYWEDDASMFGVDADLSAVDITASCKEFDAMVLGALTFAYPTADIQVTHGPDMITVNGQSGHQEVRWIKQAIHDVWESWDWVRAKQ